MLAQNMGRDEARLVRISRLEEYDVGRDLIAVVQKEQEKLREEIETSPQSCPEDWKRDCVFKAGRLSVLRELMELPAKAKGMQSK